MKTLWKNDQWIVTTDGLVSSSEIENFIPASRLKEIQEGTVGVAMWPLHMIDKTWVDPSLFVQAFFVALRLLHPNGVENIDQKASVEAVNVELERQGRGPVEIIEI